MKEGATSGLTKAETTAFCMGSLPGLAIGVLAIAPGWTVSAMRSLCAMGNSELPYERAQAIELQKHNNRVRDLIKIRDNFARSTGMFSLSLFQAVKSVFTK